MTSSPRRPSPIERIVSPTMPMSATTGSALPTTTRPPATTTSKLIGRPSSCSFDNSQWTLDQLDSLAGRADRRRHAAPQVGRLGARHGLGKPELAHGGEVGVLEADHRQAARE